MQRLGRRARATAWRARQRARPRSPVSATALASAKDGCPCMSASGACILVGATLEAAGVDCCGRGVGLRRRRLRKSDNDPQRTSSMSGSGCAGSRSSADTNR
jgi:hypothetical protein